MASDSELKKPNLSIRLSQRNISKYFRSFDIAQVVTINVNRSKFLINSIILALHSSVFDELIFSGAEEITLHPVLHSFDSINVVRDCLLFIHGESIELKLSDVHYVCLFAAIYQIDTLWEHCKRFIETCVDVIENLLEIFDTVDCITTLYKQEIVNILKSSYTIRNTGHDVISSHNSLKPQLNFDATAHANCHNEDLVYPAQQLDLSNRKWLSELSFGKIASSVELAITGNCGVCYDVIDIFLSWIQLLKISLNDSIYYTFSTASFSHSTTFSQEYIMDVKEVLCVLQNTKRAIVFDKSYINSNTFYVSYFFKKNDLLDMITSDSHSIFLEHPLENCQVKSCGIKNHILQMAISLKVHVNSPLQIRGLQPGQQGHFHKKSIQHYYMLCLDKDKYVVNMISLKVYSMSEIVEMINNYYYFTIKLVLCKGEKDSTVPAGPSPLKKGEVKKHDGTASHVTKRTRRTSAAKKNVTENIKKSVPVKKKNDAHAPPVMVNKVPDTEKGMAEKKHATLVVKKDVKVNDITVPVKNKDHTVLNISPCSSDKMKSKKPSKLSCKLL